MRVLHLIAPVSFGGGESLLVNLLQEKRPGLEESVALIYSSSPFQRALEKIGIRYWRLREKAIGHGISKGRMALESFANLLCAVKVARIVKREKIDIVHAHGYPACLLFVVVKFLARGVKGVYTHHSYRTRASWIERVILGGVYASFDSLTAVSGVAAESMNRSFPSARSGFIPIHNCVSDAFFSPQGAAAFEIQVPANKKRFVQVARFIPVKNHMLVIDALCALSKEERQRIYVVFVGEGVERARIMERVEKEALTNEVGFPGEVPHERLPALLAQMDFGLFPSENEGFGIGAVECMAAGLPVLALDNELMREVVGAAGVRVQRTRLADGFLQMLERGESLRLTARQQAAQFRASAIKDQYHFCYENALRRGGVQPSSGKA